MKKLTLVGLAVVLGLVAVACSRIELVVPKSGVIAASGAPSKGSSTSKVDPRLAAAINGFGFELLEKAAASKGGPVTVISPVSVHAALSMLANGANAETLAEIRRTLHLDSMSEADSNQAYADLITRVQANTDVELDIADSLWLDPKLSAKKAFVSANQKYFGAEVRTLALQDAGAPIAINEWVSRNTHGKIDSIVPDTLPPNAVAEIVNATYFNGVWADSFETKWTTPRPFHLADDSSPKVPTMLKTESWHHVKTPDFEAVRLPYKGGSTSMIVMLPSESSSLDALVSSMTGDAFTDLREQLRTTGASEVTLHLPTAEVTWSDSLIGDLNALSMSRVFDPAAADLSRLGRAPLPLYVDTVAHKTYMRVDEQGTEAAAVTGITPMSAGVSTRAMPIEMTVDRPYLMALVDDQSGAVLFLAAIRDPRAK